MKERLLLEQGEQPLAGLYQDFSREVVAYFIDQGVLEITEREVNRAAAYYEGKEQTQALLLNSEQAKSCRNSSFSNWENIKAFFIRRCDWKRENRSLSADYSGSSK